MREVSDFMRQNHRQPNFKKVQSPSSNHGPLEDAAIKRSWAKEGTENFALLQNEMCGDSQTLE